VLQLQHSATAAAAAANRGNSSRQPRNPANRPCQGAKINNHHGIIRQCMPQRAAGCATSSSLARCLRPHRCRCRLSPLSHATKQPNLPHWTIHLQQHQRQHQHCLLLQSTLWHLLALFY
jgi:hypothetical protein